MARLEFSKTRRSDHPLRTQRRTTEAGEELRTGELVVKLQSLGNRERARWAKQYLTFVVDPEAVAIEL